MSTIGSAHDYDMVDEDRPARTAVYSSSPSGSVAEQSLPVVARPTTRQRRRAASRSAVRFLRACIDAILRDDVPERIQRIPEYREAQTEMLRYHIVRQTR